MKGLSEDELYTTAAHELGHGQFVLKHIFDNDYKIPQFTTDNLMDYLNGAHIAKWQWDLIHDPGVVMRVFEKDEDAMAFSEKGTDFLCLDDNLALQAIEKYKYYFLPDGRIVNLDGKYQVSGFFTEKDVTESARGSIHSLRVNGFDCVHVYNADRQTVGYGTVTIKDFIVEGSESKAVRIFIDNEKKQITVKQNGQTVETISFSVQCKCIYPESEIKDIYFKTSGYAQKYVDYYNQQSDKTDVKISDDKTIIIELVDLVKKQKATNDKDEKFLGEILADKLKTYELFNGRKFIVVPLSVKTISVNQNHWNELADKVFAESGLGEKDILITIPYVYCSGIGTDLGQFFYMPGISKGKNINIDVSKLRKDYQNTQKVSEYIVIGDYTMAMFIGDIFTHTTKKALIYKGTYLANDVIECITYKTDAISGLPFNKAVQLYRQKGYNDLVRLVTEYKEIDQLIEEEIRTAAIVGVSNNYSKYTQDKYNNRIKWVEKIEELSKQVEDTYLEEFIPNKDYYNHFKEEYLDAINPKAKVEGEEKEKNSENGIYYIMNLPFNQLRKEIGYPEKGYWNYEQNHSFTDKIDFLLAKYVDKPAYATLDILSVGLGFIGFDFIPDGLGVIYSSIRGDATNIAVYSVSVLIAGPTGFAVVKGGKRLMTITKDGIVKVSDNLTDDALRAFLEKNKSTFSKETYDKLMTLSGKELKEGIESALKGNIDNIISKLGKELGEQFEKDFANNADMLSKFATEDGLLDAWKLVNSYPAFRKSEDILNAAKKLLNNSNLSNSGLTDDLLEKLIHGNRGYGAEELQQLLKGYDELVTSGTKFENISQLIVDLEKEGTNFAVGARWVQKYIVNNADEFKGVTVTFEDALKAGEKIREVDVAVKKVGDAKRIFYEFKSAKNLPPDNFADQFIKDLGLPEAENLNQIKWIFDGGKVTSLDKAKFLDELRKVDIAENVILKWTGGDDVNKLIKLIDDNFNQIFSIK
jgi:hypothetical protein